MANSIELAKKYIADPNNFNQVFRKGSLTSLLLTERVVFLDADTIKMPKYGFSTDVQGAYSRENGTTRVGLVESWDTYQLTRDMGETIDLDVMDDEETLGEGIMRRANERTRQVIVPSNDGYIFNVLATVPTAATDPTVVGAKIVTSAAATPATALSLVDAAIDYLEEAEVGVEDAVLYCTTEFKRKMANSTALTRMFGVKEVGVANVKVTFETYEDIPIVSVPTKRLGAGVEFILVNKKAVTYVNKFTESKLINLTETTDNKFGWAWKYRQYGDFFLSEGAAVIEGSGATKVKINQGVYVKKSA